jgi:hypothetical protein
VLDRPKVPSSRSSAPSSNRLAHPNDALRRAD